MTSKWRHQEIGNSTYRSGSEQSTNLEDGEECFKNYMPKECVKTLNGRRQEWRF